MRRPSASPRFAAVAALAAVACAGAARAGDAKEVRTRSLELLNEGVRAYNQGDYVQAVRSLEESASLALNSFRAHLFLGLSRIGTREYAGAIDALDVALELDPKHLSANIAMGDAQLELGDVDEARASYYRALDELPAYAAALDGLARADEALGRDDKAIERFRNAISSDAGYAPAYTHLGDLYLRQERMEEAVSLFEEAVTVRPDYAPGLNRLAFAYGRLELYNHAVATIQKAIELDPHNALHRSTLGQLQLAQGFPAAARESFTEALELDPGLPEAREGAAELERRVGRYEEAALHIDAALEDPRVTPSVARRLRERRTALLDEQSEVARLEERRAAEELTDAEREALATIYAGRSRWNEAAELQRPAPETAEGSERLAYFLFQAGRFREAAEMYGSLAGRTEDPAHRLNEGVALARLGEDAAAAAAFGRVLEREPAHGRARLYLANALLRMGRTSEAAASYRTFLDGNRTGALAERVRRILVQIAPASVPRDEAPAGLAARTGAGGPSS